ncbi:MAG: serine/threonine-protein kinase [Sandaracinaceae bacterium]
MTSAGAGSLVGKVLLGKLEVLRLLGEGGMGAVYEVRHRITKHHRALKVLHPRFASDAEVVGRLLREASVAGTLRSPHVVETFDAGQLEDGSPYVLMEMLEGETLASRIGQRPMAPGHIARLVHAAAQGLAAAHAAGIVHRDVKPENLFVVRDAAGERIKVLDFGISKFEQPDDIGGVRLTQTGRVMGTPLYMCPEQAAGMKELDARADVYALGVILYEGLAGRPPFLAETLPELIIRIHTADYPPLRDLAPNTPDALLRVVERAMAHDRTERYADARALADALAPFVTQEVGFLETIASAPPPSRASAPAAASASRAKPEPEDTAAPRGEPIPVEPALVETRDADPGAALAVDKASSAVPSAGPSAAASASATSRAPMYLAAGALAALGIGGLGYAVRMDATSDVEPEPTLRGATSTDVTANPTADQTTGDAAAATPSGTVASPTRVEAPTGPSQEEPVTATETLVPTAPELAGPRSRRRRGSDDESRDETPSGRATSSTGARRRRDRGSSDESSSRGGGRGVSIDRDLDLTSPLGP